MEELETLPSPIVVLASVPSLECGFSEALFREWATSARNTVLFTEKPPAGSVAEKILNLPKEERPVNIEMMVNEKVPLEGEELEAHEKRQQELEREKERQRRREQLEKKLERGDADMELEDLETIDSLARNPFESAFDLTYQEFRNTNMQPMFPFQEEPKIFDDYGEALDEAEYNFEDPAAEKRGGVDMVGRSAKVQGLRRPHGHRRQRYP